MIDYGPTGEGYQPGGKASGPLADRRDTHAPAGEIPQIRQWAERDGKPTGFIHHHDQRGHDGQAETHNHGDGSRPEAPPTSTIGCDHAGEQAPSRQTDGDQQRSGEQPCGDESRRPRDQLGSEQQDDRMSQCQGWFNDPSR